MIQRLVFLLFEMFVSKVIVFEERVQATYVQIHLLHFAERKKVRKRSGRYFSVTRSIRGR